MAGDYLNGTGLHRVVRHIKNAIKEEFPNHLKEYENMFNKE